MKDLHLRNKLKDYTVGIAGAGGLGSNVAVALARAGVGKIVIADYDKIEKSNLNRQYFFHDQIGKYKVDAIREIIHRIDNSILVESVNRRIDKSNIKSIFKDCDILVEALDKREEKALLISEFSQIYKNVKIVAASGISGYKSSNLIKTKRIMKNLYMVGDQIEDDEPYLPARVSIVANHQANMVIRILLGQEEV